MRSSLPLCIWVSIALAMGGCSRSATVPVQGLVKLDGNPLAGASVVFLSQEAGGRDAAGSTNAEGVFRLSTFAPGDGALPGNYKVIVQPPAPKVTGPEAKTPNEAQQAASEGGPSRPSIPIPPKYSAPAQTVLTQSVPPAGEVVLDLKTK